MIEGIPGDESYNKMLYEISRTDYESSKLFDMAVEREGRPLWTGAAWQNPNCQKKCPLGSICDKKLTQIDGNNLCYGQIYLNIPYELPQHGIPYELLQEETNTILNKVDCFAIDDYIYTCNIENDQTIEKVSKKGRTK